MWEQSEWGVYSKFLFFLPFVHASFLHVVFFSLSLSLPPLGTKSLLQQTTRLLTPKGQRSDAPPYH